MRRSLALVLVLLLGLVGFLPTASAQTIIGGPTTAGGGVPLGGTGTINTIAKFTAATTLGDSLLTDDGTNVTLGSGIFIAPAGTLAAPSGTFTGDAERGLYLQGSSVGIAGGAHVTGSLTVAALATPGAITVTPQGTGGVVTWTYKLVATVGGVTTEAGAASSTAVGNATLDGTNFNRLTWTAVAGATGYRVYRTVAGTSPATTGLIATIALGATVTVDDTGLAGGGETAPTANASGQVLVGNGTVAAPAQSWSSESNTGFYRQAAGTITLAISGTIRHQFTAGAFDIIAGSPRLMLNTSTVLTIDAANTLALRNGTAAQQFNVYGTWTDASNYIRLTTAVTSTNIGISAVGLGTGSTANVDITLTPINTGRVKIGTALITAVDGNSTPAFTANMSGTGTGVPATAAQNGWLVLKDSAGATIWIPVWK